MKESCMQDTQSPGSHGIWSSPGQGAQLVRALSPYANVAGSIPGQAPIRINQ